MASADQESVLAYIAALQNVISSAELALADASISREQASAERAAYVLASSLLLSAQDLLTPLATPTTVIVGPDDDVYRIAQEFLGDALRYKDILALNGYVGTDIPAGTQLLIPSNSF